MTTLKTVDGLPSKLKILGKTFKILLLQDGEQEEVDGLMDLRKQEISVRPQTLEQVQDTSLHEALHAISDSLRLRLSESQVHQLAAALLALLKDNPEYAQWLLTSA
jgi:hypothetical protein